MSKYAAFLRGVNLGPRRRVGSVQLRAVFEEAGCSEVDTFRTSGNVVFQAERQGRAALAQRLERVFAESLGWESKVFLRTAAELRQIAAHEPFDPDLVARSKGKVQVSLLEAKPSASNWSPALDMASEEDLLASGPRELYWLPSGGTRDSKLDSEALASLLGPSTMRTKGTLDLLTAKYVGP